MNSTMEEIVERLERLEAELEKVKERQRAGRSEAPTMIL